MTGIFRWGSRSDAQPEAAGPADVSPEETVAPSKVLPKFLVALGRHPSPVLLDLGPVVGSNVALFGERLSCKLLVQDLYQELERGLDDDVLTVSILKRLPDEPRSVDGIACWDLFDYLEPAVGRALAHRLSRVLKPGGVLHGFFATAPCETHTYTRFVVEADDAIRHRTYPARPNRRRVLSPREVDRMFEGLEMTDNILLKASCRETLFRKA